MQMGVGRYKQAPEWVKGPARVEGGYVVLDEARATRYHIYDLESLLFDLLSVFTPDKRNPTEVKAFVRRYGLLYHGAEDVGSGRCRESLRQWHSDIFRLHQAARLWLDLVETEKSGQAQTIREGMREELARLAPNHPEPSEEEWLEVYSVLLAELITEGMGDTRVGLVSTCLLDVKPSGPTRFLLNQRPSNLLAAAYTQFAFLIAHRAPISTCPGCGRLFVPKSGKQKYCTPRCASTSRWRRWKEHQTE